MRLQTHFWVMATTRSLNAAGLFCAVRAHGAESSGAVLVKLNKLDGYSALFGPAPTGLMRDGEWPGQTQDFAEGYTAGFAQDLDRYFMRLHDAPWLSDTDCEMRLAREQIRDNDVWIIEIEDRDATAYRSHIHPAMQFLPKLDERCLR